MQFFQVFYIPYADDAISVFKDMACTGVEDHPAGGKFYCDDDDVVVLAQVGINQ